MSKLGNLTAHEASRIELSHHLDRAVHAYIANRLVNLIEEGKDIKEYRLTGESTGIIVDYSSFKEDIFIPSFLFEGQHACILHDDEGNEFLAWGYNELRRKVLYGKDKDGNQVYPNKGEDKIEEMLKNPEFRKDVRTYSFMLIDAIKENLERGIKYYPRKQRIFKEAISLVEEYKKRMTD